MKEKKIEEEDFQNPGDTATDLASAFHIFDAQKKGYIESRDLREALGLTAAEIPDDELRQMLKETGLLTDRKITFAGKCTRQRLTYSQKNNNNNNNNNNNKDNKTKKK